MKLGDICHISSGGTPSRGKSHFYGGEIPWAKISDIENSTNGILTETEETITEEGLKSIGNRIFSKGTLLFAMYGSIGKVAITGREIATNQAILGIRPKGSKEIYLPYLKIWFESNKQKLINQGRGVALQNLSATIVRNLDVPLPPYSDQLHIANLLSKAGNLISQRKQSIALLDEFLKSTFLEMFGDPSFNKKKWNKLTLKDLSLRFSDGPFGSNLKTEHYSDYGIQVIRLQNIGVNRFVEKDVSYVSEAHYESVLKKYSCFPNDVVIATMGSPNVRACIVPKQVKVAINKADCVLFRVNPKLANPYYISHLLNQDGFLSLATSFIHGQTRARISSGQLAIISIPVPPLVLQTQFAQIVEKTETLKVQYQSSLMELENLYGSLSQRAFRGEL